MGCGGSTQSALLLQEAPPCPEQAIKFVSSLHPCQEPLKERNTAGPQPCETVLSSMIVICPERFEV